MRLLRPCRASAAHVCARPACESGEADQTARGMGRKGGPGGRSGSETCMGCVRCGERVSHRVRLYPRNRSTCRCECVSQVPNAGRTQVGDRCDVNQCAIQWTCACRQTSRGWHVALRGGWSGAVGVSYRVTPGAATDATCVESSRRSVSSIPCSARVTYTFRISISRSPPTRSGSELRSRFMVAARRACAPGNLLCAASPESRPVHATKMRCASGSALVGATPLRPPTHRRRTGRRSGRSTAHDQPTRSNHPWY